MIILSELSASHGCEMNKTNTILCQAHLDTEEKINKNNPGKGIFFFLRIMSVLPVKSTSFLIWKLLYLITEKWFCFQS